MTGPAQENAADVTAHDANRGRGVPEQLLLVLRVLGVAFGSALVLWGSMVALNEVVFHGFSPNCSDGNPSYDPRYCGITWRPGFPAVATAILGLALLATSVWNRRFTGQLLLAVGTSIVLVALFLLWTETWIPVTPAYPESGAPQYAQLLLGIVTTIVGVHILRSTRRSDR